MKFIVRDLLNKRISNRGSQGIIINKWLNTKCILLCLKTLSIEHIVILLLHFSCIYSYYDIVIHIYANLCSSSYSKI